MNRKVFWQCQCASDVNVNTMQCSSAMRMTCLEHHRWHIGVFFPQTHPKYPFQRKGRQFGFFSRKGGVEPKPELGSWLERGSSSNQSDERRCVGTKMADSEASTLDDVR